MTYVQIYVFVSYAKNVKGIIEIITIVITANSRILGPSATSSIGSRASLIQHEKLDFHLSAIQLADRRTVRTRLAATTPASEANPMFIFKR